jgi:hypothetical protein
MYITLIFEEEFEQLQTIRSRVVGFSCGGVVNQGRFGCVAKLLSLKFED